MDKLYKALIYDGQIMLTVIESTKIVNKAIGYHNLTPLTAATLGRTMTASLFMASNLKNDKDKLSVSVLGDGIGGHITVSVDSKLNVRGCIDNPKAELPLKPNGKLDVKNCVGKGKIVVVKSMGLKEPYTGTSEIISGELAEDFAYYYTLSEQTPTAMALGVKVSANNVCVGAGGVIIQVMPNAEEENIAKAEKLINEFTNISSKIQNYGADGLIKEYFKGVEFTKRLPKYKCICSKKYIDKLLISLGKDEILDILKEQGEVRVNCEYCDKVYVYDKDSARKLFK